MNFFCLCITSVLVITSVFSDQKTKKNHIRVFPAANQSIAGVFQVTLVNSMNKPEYSFNATEARRLCLSLGVRMASKEEVQTALKKGLETCRFGWIDEHFAVVPRIHALANCGKSQTGLVRWRASVREKFDVFCFNETDAAAQWKDATTDTPSSSSYHTTRSSPAPEKTHSAFSSSFLRSSSSTPDIIEREAEPARSVGGAQRSSGGKLVLITCTSAFLVIAVVILAYLKLERRCSGSTDEKIQREYVETEEWTRVKSIQENEKSAQDESIEMEDEE
ncbi:unnamed protein product [Ophioblennius macclurei]